MRNFNKKKISFISIFLIPLLIFSGCTQSGTTESEPHSKDFFAMDTYMTVTAYGENGSDAVEEAEKRVYELDSLLNAENKESEIYLLNERGTATLSDDTASVLQSALDYCKLTDGAFNPAMHPIMRLWGFTSGKYNVPTEESIKATLKLTKANEVSLKENKAKFNLNGLEVDLGGIAKGYTSSQIMRIFKDSGVTSGMVNLGGNVQTFGLKPDGSEWNVAIEHPDSEDYLGILKTHDKAVITSGGYERNFEKNGRTYHHIIDPTTGYPAESGLVSVTVVAENGTLADALSTSLFVMGERKAEEFWRNNRDDFDIILYADDDRVIVSEGIKDSFTTELKTEVIS